MTDPKKSFHIGIDIVGVDIPVEDLWPDGDAPENPTAEDVVALMVKEGKKTILSEWELLDWDFITFDVDGKEVVWDE